MSISPTIELIYRANRSFTQSEWVKFRPMTRHVHSLTLEYPMFHDENCTIWEDIVDSDIIDLHLDNPEFEPEAFVHFTQYIMKATNLCSLRLTGQIYRPYPVGARRPTACEIHEMTSEFVSCVAANSSIKWLSFPWTSCFVGQLVANLLPFLELELLDIGLAPPLHYETNPADELMEALRQSHSIGVFTDAGRKKTADKIGSSGFSVRACGIVENSSEYLGFHPEQKMGIFKVLSYDQMDEANELCRQRMAKYEEDKEAATTIVIDI